MDEITLRRLAAQLLAELPERIPDAAERAPVADAVSAALATPDGEVGGEEGTALTDALSMHPAIRAWMRQHGAGDDVVRGGLPGNPTTPVGLYYVCPHDDEDLVLLAVPPQPPHCPTHGVAMVLEQGGWGA